MKKKGFAAIPGMILLASLVLAVSTNAGQIQEHKMMIAIDDGSDGEVLIDLAGDENAVAIHDMQLGETRSVVDAEGRSVLITRTEDGVELNVDGKIIEVPAFDAGPHGTLTATLTAEDADVDIDVDVARAVHVETFTSDHFGGDGDIVTIISGEAIDEATRDSIRSALSSSGHTGEVVFVDRQLHESSADSAHAVHEARRIKIISREINATN